MTTGGWIFLILSWGVILSLLVYCYMRIVLDKDNRKKAEDQEADLYPKVD